MRVLVTGASGFVGRWLCSALVERGHTVTGTTLDPIASALVTPQAAGNDVEWVQADMRDRDAIDRVVQRAVPDAVFHLAGVTFIPSADADPGSAYEVNVVATARLLGALATRKVAGTLNPVVLVVGSGEQYGRHEGLTPLTEAAPQRPMSVYGATKVAQEIAALQAWRASGLRVVCTRSFNHTGPGQTERMLMPALVRRCLALRGKRNPRLPVGNTSPVRDFLHVRDVVDAYLRLAENAQAGESYNVASGRGRSVGDLAALVLARVGVQAVLEPVPELMRPVDLPVLVGDSTKLREATGWRPRSEIEHVIDELIDAAAP